MRGIRTEALLLRSVDFGESDRVLHLLVPEVGRLTAMAKGARRSKRRFGGTLDFFNHLRIQYDHGKPGAMARIDQAALLRAYTPMRTDPARFALGCFLLELLDRLAPDGGARDEMRRLFGFALSALSAISSRPADLRLRVFVELCAFDALGVRPELRRCVRCGDEVKGANRVAFHVGEGGPLCGGCTGGSEAVLPVTLGTLRALEQGLRLDFARLDRLRLAPATLAEARILLSRFQRFHLGLELRSESFLDAVLPGEERPVPASPVYSADSRERPAPNPSSETSHDGPIRH